MILFITNTLPQNINIIYRTITKVIVSEMIEACVLRHPVDVADDNLKSFYATIQHWIDSKVLLIEETLEETVDAKTLDEIQEANEENEEEKQEKIDEEFQKSDNILNKEVEKKNGMIGNENQKSKIEQSIEDNSGAKGKEIFLSCV